jgi:Flp pilus assembly protein TadG
MNKRSRFSKGQMLAVFTLALPALLGVMGLGADIGVLYFNYAILQKAADAAALAGAEYLVASPLATPQSVPSPACGNYPVGGTQTTNAQSAACTYVTYNGALASETASINVPASKVPARVPAGVQTIQVVLDRPTVKTYFLRMVGLSSLRANAQAIAMAPTAICGAGNGMFPIGMPNVIPGYTKWTDTIGQTITLVEGVSSGDWEWMSIPNSNYQAPSTQTTTTSGGNSQLASNITSGCNNCNVNINNWLTPQTGNGGNSSNIVSAIDDRISATTPGVTLNSCSKTDCSNGGPPLNSSGTPVPPSDAQQLVTIPVVDWSTANGGSAAVQVDGFITAWLKAYTVSSGVTSLTVEVLGSPANTQVTSGNCAPTYPGLTQAELVQ